MADLTLSNRTLLTPEILAEMPQGLSPMGQYKWKKQKENELWVKALYYQDDSQTTTSSDSKTEKSETNDRPVSETTADDDLSNNEISTETEEKVSDKPAVAKEVKSKSKSTQTTLSKRKSADYKTVHDIPCGVLTALRRLFPGGTSNGDLLAAAGYIVTDGDCEVSETAMQLVESYNRRDNDDLEERLSNIERMLRDGTRMWQSIELCTCYNTFDRRYGSKERRVSPKETEFREQGNLDMLDRLRRQADDQRKVDNIERGRDIYNSNKDKNDKK